MSLIDAGLAVFLLGASIWSLLFLLPRARRNDDRFGVICSLLMALLGLLGWLFIGIRALST